MHLVATALSTCLLACLLPAPPDTQSLSLVTAPCLPSLFSHPTSSTATPTWRHPLTSHPAPILVSYALYINSRPCLHPPSQHPATHPRLIQPRHLGDDEGHRHLRVRLPALVKRAQSHIPAPAAGEGRGGSEEPQRRGGHLIRATYLPEVEAGQRTIASMQVIQKRGVPGGTSAEGGHPIEGKGHPICFRI